MASRRKGRSLLSEKIAQQRAALALHTAAFERLVRPPPPAPPPPSPPARTTCLTCLATDVRMCDLEKYNLRESYVTLVGYQCGAEEGMPDAVCYLCARKLNKFKVFRATSQRAYSILLGFLDEYDQISSSNVKLKQSKLGSELALCDLRHVDIKPIKEQKIYNYIKVNLKPENVQGNDPKVYEVEEASNIEYEADKQLLCSAVAKENVVENHTNDEETNNLARTRKRKSNLDFNSDPPVAKRDHSVNKISSRRYLKEIAKVTVLSQEEQMAFYKHSKEKYAKLAYCCELCGTGCLTESSYQKHMLKHDPSAGDMICDICKFCFKTREHLRHHIKSSHMKKFECRKCDFVTSSIGTIRYHAKWHADMLYHCDACNITYNELERYTQHMFEKHPESVACAMCGVTLISVAALKKHQAKVHQEQDESSIESEVLCECGVVFRNEDAFRVHRTTYPGHETEHGLISCEFCLERFADAAFLLQHMKKHGKGGWIRKQIKDDMDVECEQCGERFDGGREYLQHFRRDHPGKKRTQYFAQELTRSTMCELCGKVITNKNYRNHMEGHNHTKSRVNRQRQYKCNVCEKMFITSITLRNHRVTHTKRPRLKCPVCGKEYVNKYVLEAHRRTHSDDNPNTCDICGKGFTQKHWLICHRRVHTKERPYQCDVCGRRFAMQDVCKKHVKHVHTDATPFSCDICGKAFKYQYSMKEHIQCVHFKKPWPKRDRTQRGKMAAPRDQVGETT